jgi:hypothetical protein
MEIITDITHEFGANSRFKGNSFCGLYSKDFSSFNSKEYPWLNINLALPLIQMKLNQPLLTSALGIKGFCAVILKTNYKIIFNFIFLENLATFFNLKHDNYAVLV